jgi:DNA-binding HxlR family transcriptional regulator
MQTPTIPTDPDETRPRRPLEITAAVLGGRFKPLIVWTLFWGSKGFYQLLRDVEHIPRRVLALELGELERLGMVARRFQAGKVEYELTEVGASLKLVVGAMYEWGLMARRFPLPGLSGEGAAARPLPLDLEAAASWKVVSR